MCPIDSGRAIEDWNFGQNHDFDHFQWHQHMSTIWSEVVGHVIYGQKRVLETSKILVHTLDDLIWCLETFLKNHEKCHILALNASASKCVKKKKQFSWFFKKVSRHHKRSSKVCTSILEVRGARFWPYITFSATSGRMMDMWWCHWKWSKSWFWPKIQSSIARPESIVRMVYGRKWIPEVF